MTIKKIAKRLMFLAITAAACGAFAACGDDKPKTDKPQNPGGQDTPQPGNAVFAKGADVSWVTELEDKGVEFFNKNGESSELMTLLRNECGVNAVRLRVWVNPAEKYNSIDDVLVKARRAHKLGLKIMIDFHLSDSWADPGKQKIPAEWQNLPAHKVAAKIGGHVTEMLAKLKNEGITPAWVQIGNETTPGMLLPLGAMNGDNAHNFPLFLNAGYDAVKAVFPETAVIVHLDKGNNRGTYTWFFDLLAKNNGKFDMIGMSLYPITESGDGDESPAKTDTKAIDDCIGNIAYLKRRYGKNVMICEIGFHHTQAADCKNAIAKIMHSFAGKTDLQGIFYWEPEAELSNTGYDKGCFRDGRPTCALDAFLN